MGFNLPPKRIVLGIDTFDLNQLVRVKRGFIGSLRVQAAFIGRDKKAFVIPEGTTAKVRMLKPDMKKVLNDTEQNGVVEGNTVTFKITEQMQAYPGEGALEIILFNGGETVTSSTCGIKIIENVHNDSGLESTDEWLTVINTLAVLEEKIQDANEAIGNANEAAEKIINETLMIYKPNVANYAAIATTYPNPEKGWVTVANDTKIRWRYNGTAWVNSGTVTTGPIATETTPGNVQGNGNVSVKSDGAMWADQYKDKGTATGTSVQFTNADDALIAITSIKGKSSQTTTTHGIQLFDKAKVTTGKYIQPDTGLVTNSTYNNNVSAKIYVGTNTNVTLSGMTFVQPNTPVGIAFYNASNTRIGGTSYQNATGNGTYAIPVNTAYFRHTINNVDLNTAQAEFGITATSYASFVPDSPSPDYPSVITGAGDTPFDIVACGKNLFDEILEQGSFFGDGTLNNSSTTRVRSSNYTILSAGTYRISFSGAQTWVLYVYDLKNNFISSKSLTGWQTNFTFTLDGTYKVKFGFKYTNDANILPANVTNVQLEPGSTATPYEPHQSNKLTISGLPMNDLPNGTADERAQNTDGSWKHRNSVYDKKYNSTENWTWRNNGDGVTTVSFNLPNQGITSSLSATNSRCTHFNVNQSSTTDGIIGYACDSSINGIAFEVPRSILTGYSDSLTSTQKAQLWKDYLAAQNTAGTPVRLQAPLATPVETQLTDNYYLTSYPGITNVFTTSNPQVTFTAAAKSELWARNYLQDLHIADIKDSNVTFSESTSDASLTSGSKISVLISLIKYKLTNLLNNIGNLSSLTTTVKTNLVDAVNELVSGKIDKTSISTTDTENSTIKVAAAAVTYALGQEIDALKTNYDNHNLGYHARISLTSGTIFNTIASKISQGYTGGDIILVAYAPSDTYNNLPFGLIKWSLVWGDIATLQFITARVNNLVTRSISPSESFDTGWVLH